MATIQANTSESIFKIQNWLGVNEAPEGEARLKQGEAAAMRNFKITAGGALKKRGGSVNVAGLMQAYNLEEGERVELYRETGITEMTLDLYPRGTTDSVGTPIPDGQPVQSDFAGLSAYTGYFAQAGEGLYKLLEGVYTPPQTLTGPAGLGFTGDAAGLNIGVYVLAFDEPPVFHNGAWDTSKGTVTSLFSGDGWAGSHGIPSWGYEKTKYLIPNESGSSISAFRVNGAPTAQELLEGINTTGRYVEATMSSMWADVNQGFRVDLTCVHYMSPYYSWYFARMGSVGNGSDSVVRGLWSGFVGGREVLCAACNGYLWELEYTDGVWSKTACGSIGTERDVSMFGFDEKLYILNGTEYKVWDGTLLETVEGYAPLVVTACPPEGGGTALEQVNKLTARRRARFSPDGAATAFTLPEGNLAAVESAVYVAGGAAPAFTPDLEAGKVTFQSPPEKGTASLEITYRAAADDKAGVRAMRFMELYNGAQDSRVFLYGDGTNRCFYSGLDENGRARADYFPDLNVAHIGDANTPVTGLIRHYDKLLAFKLDSAWVLSYDSLTLEGGAVTAGFTVTPVNRSVGNCAPGQVLLVENQPRTLDGRSVVEWKASNSGSITGDQRNAKRVSQRVDNSIRKFNLETAKTFYDKYAHEYYVIGSEGTALVNGVDADAWYIYTDFDAVCLINYKDELYFGTADGYLRHFTEAAFSDNGRAIDCYWESGSMPFDRDFMRKYSAMIWIGIRPEEKGYLKVTAETDRKSDFAEYSFTTDDAGAVPTMQRIKLKAKKFTYYKLILENNTADTTATVVSADIRVRNTGYVR